MHVTVTQELRPLQRCMQSVTADATPRIWITPILEGFCADEAQGGSLFGELILYHELHLIITECLYSK
jgi:hypothetical protein